MPEKDANIVNSPSVLPVSTDNIMELCVAIEGWTQKSQKA